MGEIVDIRDYRQKQEAEKLTKLEFEARVCYLEGYVNALHHMRSVSAELEILEMDYGPAARGLNGMPGGKRTDGSDRIIGRMEARKRMERVVGRSRETAVKRRDDVEQVIEAVANSESRTVLRYRYINDMDVGEIAEKMNYSYRQIINIHKRGIRKIKPPRNVISRIKAELMEDHPGWAEIQVKFA